jgi:hypothetical protein
MEQLPLNFSLVASYDKSIDSGNKHEFGGIPEHLCISDDGKHIFTGPLYLSMLFNNCYLYTMQVSPSFPVMSKLGMISIA